MQNDDKAPIDSNQNGTISFGGFQTNKKSSEDSNSNYSDGDDSSSSVEESDFTPQ
jgi:hypothetical protein